MQRAKGTKIFSNLERKRFLFRSKVSPERNQQKLIWVGPIWKKKKARILRLSKREYTSRA